MFAITATPSSITAGSAVTVSVVADDAYGNTASYAGAITLGGVNEGTFTTVSLTGGTYSGALTLTKAGTEGVTVHDGLGTVTSSLITVTPAASTKLVVTGPSTTTAGSPVTLTVTSEDIYNNVETGDTSAVTFAGGGTGAILPTGATLTAGVGTFSSSLFTAGTTSITASDSTDGDASTLTPITVSAAAVSKFVVTPASQTDAAGTSNAVVTVTAEDTYGNAAIFATSDVITLTGSTVGSLATATLAAGSSTLNATLSITKAGSQSVSAADVSNSGSALVTITPTAITKLVVSGATSTVAGSPITLTVMAEDQFNNIETADNTALTFTSSDSGTNTILPLSVSLSAGQGAFSAKLTTAATNASITVNDSADGKSATLSPITVTAAAPVHYQVTVASAAIAAGTADNVTLTAVDQYGNATSFAASQVVTLSSSTSGPLTTVTLGANTSSISTPVTLTKAGSQTISAADGVYGNSTSVSVTPATASKLVVGSPTSTVAGTPITLSVTVEDAYNNIETTDTAGLTFTSSDSGTFTLLPTGSLTSGAGAYSAKLTTASTNASITIGDSTDSLSATIAPITVSAAAPTKFAVAPSSQTVAAGTTNASFTMTAEDQYGNAATFGVSEVITLTGSTSGSLATATLTAGSSTVSSAVTITKAGSQTVSASDGAQSGSGTVTVTPTTASKMLISGPVTTASGAPFTLSVTVEDQYNNVETTDSASITLASSDPSATLTNGTLTGGIGLFSGKLATPTNSASITASDSTDSLSATLTPIVVVGTSAGTPAQFVVTPAVASGTAGTAVTVTLEAEDTLGNAATFGASQVITLSGSVSGSLTTVVLPAGQSTVTVPLTITTAGSQTLTGADASVHGSDTVSIAPAAISSLSVIGPSSTAAGAPITLTVTAKDQYGNVESGDNAAVTFTSSDAGTGVSLPSGASLTAGVGTFSATLVTASTHASVTAAQNSVNATLSPITVTSSVTTHFQVTTASSTTAGTAVGVTVTAEDAYNNVVTSFPSTTVITLAGSADGTLTTATLTSGTATVPVTLTKAGSETITASNSYRGTSSAISVAAAAVNKLAIVAPSSTPAGSSFNFTVSAEDKYGNVVSSDNDHVTFTVSDTATGVVDPVAANLASGTGTFSATLIRSGNQTIAASDTTNGGVNGATATVNVVALTATHFSVGVPSYVTNSTNAHSFPFTIVLSALDQYNNVATGYTGTVTFSTSDTGSSPSPTLPGTYTFTAGDNSVHVFANAATLVTPGLQTISATDTTISGTSDVSVTGTLATHFAILPASTAETTGSAFAVTVEALDAANNVDPSYSGTVTFSSTDSAGGVILPANYTFTTTGPNADDGEHVFSSPGVELITVGTQTVTVSDSANTLTGSTKYTVVSATPTHFVVSETPTSLTAGSSVSLTVTAEDANNNVTTAYSSTTPVTLTDSVSGSLTTIFLTAGTDIVSLAATKAGLQTITAANTINGTSNSFSVTPAATSQFAVTGPSTTTAGSGVSLTVTAEDQYGNPTPSYSSTTPVTLSDSITGSLTTVTLTNGTATTGATLTVAGSQTLTATDSVDSGTLGISVSPGALSKFVVTPSSTTTTAGVVDQITIAAEDVYNNVETGFSSTTPVTVSASLNGSLGTTTLSSGTGTFNATLTKAGVQTVTASGAVTGTSTAITVNAAAASQLVISAPSSALAGTQFGVTVIAEDQYNNVATGYTGSVAVTGSGSAGTGTVSPTSHSYVSGDGGEYVFGVTAPNVGTEAITANDATNHLLASANVTIATTAAAPVITLNPTANTFVAGSSGVLISPNLTVNEATAGINITGATIVITNVKDLGSEQLIQTTTVPGINFSYSATGPNAGTATLSGSGTAAQYQSILEGLEYVDTAGTPTATPARTITFQVTNSVSEASNVATSTISFAVAPTISLASTSGTYLEGSGWQIIDGGVQVTDAESSTLLSATVAISSGYQSTDDLLQVNPKFLPPGSNTTSGTYEGVTYTVSGNPLQLVLTGKASVAIYDSFLQNIQYEDTSLDPSHQQTPPAQPPVTRQFSFSVNDGITTSSLATKTVTIQTIDNPPTVVTSSGSTTFTIGSGTPVTIDPSVVATDPDTSTISGATVTISSGRVATEDTLSLGSVSGASTVAGVTTFTDGDTVTGTVSSGALVFSGTATQSDYTALLEGVQYVDTNNGAAAGTRAVTFVISNALNSGTNANSTNTKTISLVTPTQRRFDFVYQAGASSYTTTPTGFIAVLPTTGYGANGYGWSNSVNSFNDAVPAGAGITASDTSLYQTGATGIPGSSRTFTISTVAGNTYDLRAYVGDSSTNRSTTVTIGNATLLGTSALTVNTTTSPQTNMYNSTGVLFSGANAFVANGSYITVTLSSTAGGWAINGLDFAVDASNSGSLGSGSGLPNVAQEAPAAGPNTSASAASVQPLTMAQLQPVVNQAIALWASAGLTPAQIAKLESTQFVIQDLSKQGDLGLTGADAIYIDPTALGYGWYIDATPGDNSAFGVAASQYELHAGVDSPAYNKMDLLTLVAHELGHIIGLLDYAGSGDLMDGTLGTGTRRLPSAADVDAVLTGDFGSLSQAGNLVTASQKPVAMVQTPPSLQSAQVDDTLAQDWVASGVSGSTPTSHHDNGSSNSSSGSSGFFSKLGGLGRWFHS